MKRFFRKYFMHVLFGAVIVGLAAYGIVADAERQSYKQQLTAYYQKSYEELVTDVNSLQSKLGKLAASSSDSMASLLLLDLWRQAGATQDSIADIPVSVATAAPLTQFVNRTGGYCRSLAQKLWAGGKLSDEDMKQIEALENTCADLNGRFDEIWKTGYVPALEMRQADYYAAAQAGGGANTQNLDFTSQQYPQLQYDGPFSESTENKTPKGLGNNDITVDDAKKAALLYLGAGYESLQQADDLNGVISAYCFNGTCADGAFTVYVTKKGGSILYFMTHRASDVAAMPTDERYQELADTAIAYLKARGYPDLKPSYAQFYNGMALINLAPLDNGIVLYPDLVKVWVDIDTGRVMGVDAYNYLMCHTQRIFPAPKLTQDDAQKSLNVNLQVESARLALIPTEQQQEVVCWEFTGKVNGRDYIVYIDAQDGREVNILQIQHTNEGSLVM